ncbi:O-linked N-acetylglucosamine transferase, SPINDLY family protein [Cyanobacterium aponinum]|uniref:O-linked N-acetylglucosamine transferase, SPINDLY family protein n=1 Tax=Cyanobacterium aponinum 0216 TaxID=2676140 RepID=A0A844GYC1_9CHRO|nr:O-linked N-acetylglucosamine transferase, SPINDLY family protein [Cyanobacterium aponinum]MTF38976.1 O-linked N-acetylglucosamine transferase, SPINDLY family protein [Cyanobacterium aponinum 0216]
MSQWHPSVISYLEKKDYQEISNIYEQLVEQEPDHITHYWYLGLSYLLLEREEKAQSTWFFVFCQGEEEEVKVWQRELIEILETEAENQKKENNYKFAELIRLHIKEIDPLDVNNLLGLVQLGFLRDCFSFKSFGEWNLFQLLEEARLSDIEIELLWDVVQKVIPYPSTDSIYLLKISLKILSGAEDSFNSKLQEVYRICQEAGFDRSIPIHGAYLLEECLIYDSENFNLLRDISTLYLNDCQWEKTIEYILKLEQLSAKLPETLYANYLLLNVYLSMANWEKALGLFPKYYQILSKVVKEQPDIDNKFIRECSLITTQPLFYLKDTPSQNRHIINGIGKLYQKHAQETICCSVNFVPSKQFKKRTLKVGYVAATFKRHPVGLLSRALMNHHNRDEFEIFIYAFNSMEDYITQEWFKNNSNNYRNLDRSIFNSMSTIQKDEIDILVDLDTLTFNLTNLIMALKPAPVQITWLGLDACGLPAIDYFIADNDVLPDDAQEYYSEKIWRLPNIYLGVDGFEVGLPSISRQDLEIPRDAVVYMSLQTGLKRHPDCIRLQMKILSQVANSYFLVSGSNRGEATRKIVEDLFSRIALEEGVNPQRIKVLPFEALDTYRANLNIGDVVLDTYPFNGATTTLDALWLNIPLVTRTGEQFHARQGYTFLKNLGIEEGIAWTDEEYIEWGIRFGTDEELRKQVSWKLRESKKTSPLWNGKEFTKEMEKAYQQMWEIYLKSISK